MYMFSVYVTNIRGYELLFCHKTVFIITTEVVVVNLIGILI
jgi:hypothetical protein